MLAVRRRPAILWAAQWVSDHLSERCEPEHMGLAGVNGVLIDHLHEGGSQCSAMPCSGANQTDLRIEHNDA
jgi:hypothetical protein